MAGQEKAARVPRPLEHSYASSLAVAIVSLVPFVVVSTAAPFYQNEVMHSLGTGRTALQIITGMSEAGYAFGALLGGDVAQRFAQRPSFLLCEALFALGALLAAAAPGVLAYGIGLILLGFSTGLLLIVALPPLVQRFSTRRLPVTAAMINIGFFGASAAGPLVGGAVAAGHDWRWFHGALCGMALAVLLLAFFTLPDRAPPNRGLKFDRLGILLGLPATVLPFWAVSELGAHGFGSFWFVLPLGAGAACLLALLLFEYHAREPLSPVKPMSSTFPALGVMAATFGGAVFVTLLMLSLDLLKGFGLSNPVSLGLLFWPQMPGALLTAALLGILLHTRFLPVLVLFGMVMLVGAGLLLLQLGESISYPLVLAAAGLMGLGAGATVSPGLYLAGFSLPARMLGRSFALVELVRSVGDYVLSPVMRQVAKVSSTNATPIEGIGWAITVTLALAAVAILSGVALHIIGGGHLPRPDLEGWLERNRAAYESPPLGAALRRSSPATRRDDGTNPVPRARAAAPKRRE